MYTTSEVRRQGKDSANPKIPDAVQLSTLPNPIARTNVLTLLADTNSRTRALLRDRADIRYETSTDDKDFVCIDIDGIPFGKAMVFERFAGKFWLSRIDTDNQKSQAPAVPGAGSLLMLGVVTLFLCVDFRTLEWKSADSAYDFYAQRFLPVFSAAFSAFGLVHDMNGYYFEINKQ